MEPKAHLSVYIIPPMAGFLVLIGLSIVSLIRRDLRRKNILFALISFLAALLNLDIALISVIQDEQAALKLDRATHLLFVFSIPIFIMFVHEFLEIHNRHWLEIISIFFCVSLLPIIPSDFYYQGMYNYQFGRMAKAGGLFSLFAALIAVMLVYSLSLIYAAMMRARDRRSLNRIRYIFWGMGLAALLLSFNILPVFGVPIYPLGNFSFIPSLILAYGVLRYDLLDIGTFMRRGLLFFLLTLVLTLIYVLIIFLFHRYFMMTGIDSLSLSLILALIIVVFFDPLKQLLKEMIERHFFEGRYNYRVLLRDLSGRLSGSRSLDEITRSIEDGIKKSLFVSTVKVFLREHEKNSPQSANDYSMAFDVLRTIGNIGGKEIGPFRRTELIKFKPVIKEITNVSPLLESLGIEIITPIPKGRSIIGFMLLGQKETGEMFVDEDLELLATIANQAAIAIENIRSYEQLRVLNKDLERIIGARTEELRKLLIEKERTQEQLIRSESLAAIGQLVAGTAHELNNPIAGAMSLIESSIDTIGEFETNPEKRKEVIEDLEFSLGELRRAASIIRSLLDISRQTTNYLEQVNINRVIEDALRVLHNQYKNLDVFFDKDYGEIPAINGNFGHLSQVIINVIKNAIQSLPNGRGRISLITAFREDKGIVEFVCRDTGVGIPAAYLKDIFKPFFTTKPTGSGTGLGLYISHEIIRRHEGQITVKSEESKGTEVTIELPIRRQS